MKYVIMIVLMRIGIPIGGHNMVNAIATTINGMHMRLHEDAHITCIGLSNPNPLYISTSLGNTFLVI